MLQQAFTPYSPNGDVIKSRTGVQQGDPLGCALFAMVLADALESKLSKFKSLYWSAYHDDLTLSGKCEEVELALNLLGSLEKTHGLVVNLKKSEWHSWTPPPLHSTR